TAGIISGGADLTGNTGTMIKNTPQQTVEHPEGRLLAYGVREHGMGGVMNGLTAHGGILPIGGTFFVFSDYMRGSVRLAALSRAHVIYSWTHDSVGLGQDGPTHQPIEQLASLRAMPGLQVIRPADANETAQAWRLAVDGEEPAAMILSRQDLPVLAETAERGAEGVAKGGYVLVPEAGDQVADVVLVSTGSEVHVCVNALGILADRGLRARVVSLPCWEWFEDQDDEYRASVLPAAVPTLAVEAAASFGWDRYADDSVSIDTFGSSAPGAVALANFGFTAENVADRAVALVERRPG
ncbi:MAG TPA: transketolase C-terminal domain-containing protein, partial [Acidimicrobiales bacterium]|nr:transketolase C-terminal domain-containing protein [Acidimicrobiales bacterium]